MTSQSKNLWQNRDFLKLWSAQTVSGFGSQAASLAYSLTAILVLQASPFQMGILRAISSASAVLVGFFIGVFVDRMRRKPLLIFSDLGLAVSSALIFITAFLGILKIEYLFVIQFFIGALSIVSEVSAMAFLPSVVEKENLVEGNSKFAMTASAATVAGPGVSGFLIQILTAPTVIIFDAISFFLSAIFIWQIRQPEPAIPAPSEKRSVREEIAEGLSFVYTNPILRPLAEGIALHFLFMLMISTVFTLYAIRELQLEPFLLGVIFSAMGFGFFLGAVSVNKVTKFFGQGKAMVLAALLNAFACLLIPLSNGRLLTFTLIAAHFLLAFGIQISGINLMSLRQSITPHNLQGRMNGSFRFVNVLMMMFGALLAGFLGEKIGLRTTLFIGAAGMSLPFLRLFFSPVRNLTQPAD